MRAKSIGTRKCIICEREFERRIKPATNRTKSVRPCHCVTCSKNCSKIYARAKHHISNIQRSRARMKVT